MPRKLICKISGFTFDFLTPFRRRWKGKKFITMRRRRERSPMPVENVVQVSKNQLTWSNTCKVILLRYLFVTLNHQCSFFFIFLCICFGICYWCLCSWILWGNYICWSLSQDIPLLYKEPRKKKISTPCLWVAPFLELFL